MAVAVAAEVAVEVAVEDEHLEVRPGACNIGLSLR